MKTIMSVITVLILSAILMSAGQTYTITGKVTDETGSPLPGVTVVVKSTNHGVVSGVDGKYSINVADNDKTIVFSCIGYESREIKISGRLIIDVVMKTSNLQLEEVVVSGYAVKDKHRGNRVASLEMKSVGRMAYDASPPATYYNPDFNTEGYSTIHENGYKDVLKQPLSTFSVDVDKASYSNVRRFINQGQLPPVDAVRVEEMINYFSYNYPEPEGEHPFSVYTELSTCPWNGKHQLLHIGLKGKSMDKEELPPSNLVFLLDVSGSMNSPNKLPLLKSAFRMLVNELRASDRVAIVVYAGAAGTVLESTPGNRKEKIMQAIENLQAGGSTAGGQGLQLAYKLASQNFAEGGNNRIILATDGDFNIGVSSNAEMERLVEKERGRGIYMTVLGFGMGNYKDDKMEILADKGNGNYAYIDNIQEARKVLVSEFGGTLFTIAKDVKFQLEFNPKRVKAYRLIGYENRLLNDEDFNDDRKDAGEIGAGHTVTALYELIPAGTEEISGKIDPLKYQENRGKAEADLSAELLTVKLRYKKPDGNTSILIEKPVRGKVLDMDQASDNFRFSAAVAEFGILLRNSEYKASASFEQVTELAGKGRGADSEGYRGEFIRLVKTTESLQGLSLRDN
ncbi:MAG TPA: von Willebrand factor type A domain-containing protein [Bacteroidales bacterium]|nr:von Willebrand factor type A domain-containing protein [Bacteroidales bacterium]